LKKKIQIPLFCIITLTKILADGLAKDLEIKASFILQKLNDLKIFP